MNQLRTLFLLSIVCLSTSILFTGGCGQSESNTSSTPEPKADGERVIAVVPKGTAHEFWQAVHAGAKTAGKELDVIVEWNGPQTETQKEMQISIIEDFIVRKVDGIVLAPQDENAMVGAVEKAARQGIPTAIFDSGIQTEKYLSFVATDNYKGGVAAAHELAKRLNNKGTVIITRVDPGSASTNEREKGFEDTLKESYPDIEVVGAQYGYSDKEKSRAVTEDLLSAHPDVDAVYGPNESSTFGALLALQARGLAGKKIFVGFDSSPDLNKALENGEIHALVLQDPFKMGYEGVKAVVEHLDGKPVERRIDTGVYVVTKENMTEESNQLLLSPDLSILTEG